MKLRTQTMIVVVGSFLLFALSMFFSLEAILNKEYEDLERQSIEDNMLRVANLVRISQQSQLAVTEDYAVWTETYDFIGAPDEKYLADNWPETVFNRFQLQAVFFVNSAGEIVAGKSVNSDTGVVEPLPATFVSFVKQHGSEWVASTSDAGKVGIFNIGAHPLIVAMQPIFDNEKALPSRGLIITFRPFDDKVVAQLSGAARVPLALGAAGETAASTLTAASPLTVFALSDEEIKGEYAFLDYYGKPVLSLYSVTGRHIKAAGDHSIHYAVIAFLLLGTLFSIIAPSALNRLVLQRLYFLIDDIDDITWTAKAAERVRVLGKDELAGLAAKINEMLATLFAEKKMRLAAMSEVEKANRHLERRVMQKAAQLKQQFFIDQLTDLPNRFCLIRDYQDTPDPSIAILQLRNFRKFSEFWGHDIADEVEKKVATLLYSFANSAKVIVYHLATGEFAFMAMGVTEDQFIKLAHFAQKLVEGMTITAREQVHKFLITIGIAIGKPNGIEQALMAVDFAREGMLNLQVYNESLPTREDCRNNLYWIQEVREALREDRVTLYYQPIQGASQPPVNEYEVLVRLLSRDGQVILPGQFLPIIKKTNIYAELTETILRKALHHFADRKEHFSINLCAADLTDQTTRSLISEALKRTSLARRVCFELVESDEFKDLPALTSFIHEVKSAGAKIAIDDFGSGYCNFSQIVQMEPDYIKIDGSLIQQLDHCGATQTVVKGIIDFAHGLGAKTVAEHVHSEQIMQVAKEIGIDFLQGFYIGEPQAALPPIADEAAPQAEAASTPTWQTSES